MGPCHENSDKYHWPLPETIINNAQKLGREDEHVTKLVNLPEEGVVNRPVYFSCNRLVCVEVNRVVSSRVKLGLSASGVPAKHAAE